MGRPPLSPEERMRSKERSRMKKNKRAKARKQLGLCRDCDEKLCASSKVFCESHLEKHRSTCREANKKYKRSQITYLKNRARGRGEIIEWDQSAFDQWLNSQERRCAYCGIEEPQLKSKPDKKKRKLTVDRMDNSRGYELDNMCLACFRCNNTKSNFFTALEWSEICDKFIKPRLNEYHGLG